MPDTGTIPRRETPDAAILAGICARLRQAAATLERSAYDLATVHAGPDVTHLILSAETVERIIDRLSRQAHPD